MKKLMLILVALAMMVMPLTVFAANPDPDYFGVWTYLEGGDYASLTICPDKVEIEQENLPPGDGTVVAGPLTWTAYTTGSAIALGLGYNEDGYNIVGPITAATGAFVPFIGANVDFYVLLHPVNGTLWLGGIDIEFEKEREAVCPVPPAKEENPKTSDLNITLIITTSLLALTTMGYVATRKTVKVN